jgi:DNA-binding CsgD family transcriptional regulator
MGQDRPAERSRPRSRAALQQRVARTALEVSHAVIRSEDVREYLVGQAHMLFAADAGAGLTTWRHDGSSPADPLSVVVAGAPPLPPDVVLRARAVAGRHPGMLAMARAGTTGAVRVSDHTDLARFWATETYWRMHGHSDGRYPASALLLHTPQLQVFLGLHRRHQDFSDTDLALLAELQRPVAAAIAFRVALDDTVRLLQHRSMPGPDERARRPALPRWPLDAAVALCSDYVPTKREGEVLALAAQGWTNQQIGRRLGITERTVRKHLGAVYDKAGVRGRAAAAAWWERRHS